MDDETFNIYYAGEILEGHDPASVRKGIAVLFNAGDATLDKLFSGTTQLIRRGVDREQALRYKAAMERAGARPRIARNDAGAQASGFSLAAPGSDVLRPEERRRVAPVDVDTASLSVAPVGERLGAEPGPAPPPPPAASLSIAPPGEDLPGLPRSAVPPPPDVSGLALAGEDAPRPTRPAADPVAAPALDLAEPGADVLEERYRHQDEQPPPATDHLELEP
ncbi:MAG TPA: hypothetical protein VJ947_03705 [Pseudohaliea sp.]|nr:hypothetical protein [Pseudohaliea sp.]